MAKLENPWRCDICKRIKEPTNGWLIGMATTWEFRVLTWDDAQAEVDGAVHLCGVECAQKWLNEQLGRMVSK
jgi:hypothetical protein